MVVLGRCAEQVRGALHGGRCAARSVRRRAGWFLRGAGARIVCRRGQCHAFDDGLKGGWLKGFEFARVITYAQPMCIGYEAYGVKTKREK
jgi:hypothetical protein